jgi:fructosamine-3-kinase
VNRVREIAAAALRQTGLGAVHAVVAVGGGDIAAAYRVETARRRVFLKVGAAAHPFGAEAQALTEIAATRTLRVPQVLAAGVAEAAGYLLLEWIDLADSGDWAAAGRQLAALHACTQSRYGWSRGNAIGASPQSNAQAEHWSKFYCERRLRPQFEMARSKGLSQLASLEEHACRAAGALLDGHDPPPSLLHGDLWRGNLAFDSGGAPVVFDPATYYGDAETDLAMTRLFGGFADRFYRAYDETRPPEPGAAQRLSLYQLYHVLNHANMFGGGYVAQAVALVGSLQRSL